MAKIKKSFIVVNDVDDTLIRLRNDSYFRARNAANSADINILKVNASDIIVFGSLPQAAGTPSSGNDLVNKTYADSISGSIAPDTIDPTTGAITINPAAGANTSLPLLLFNNASNQNPAIAWNSTADTNGLKFRAGGSEIGNLTDTGNLQFSSFVTSTQGMYMVQNFLGRGGGHRIFFNDDAVSKPAIELTEQNHLGIAHYMSTVQVTGSAADIPSFVVKGYTSQSADMIQFQNVSNGILSGFDLGGIFFGKEVSTPGNPASTFHKLYFKNDSNIYLLNSSGNEFQVISSGGNTANITISQITNAQISISDSTSDPAWDFFGNLTSPGGTANTGGIRARATAASELAFFTSSEGTANASRTKHLLFETGNKTAGTGDSGGFYFKTGTSAGGARGIFSVDANYADFTNALIGSSLIPNGALTHDLGASGAEWNNLFVNNIYASGNCGSLIIDVENGLLYDNAGSLSINFFGRQISGAGGAPMMNWGTNSDQIEFFINHFKVPATNTAGGTTGAQTINKMSGSVNFAAGASSLVVTNSNVAADSIVLATISTDDATATLKNVVAGSGSFTIKLTAAATAETRVKWFVVTTS